MLSTGVASSGFRGITRGFSARRFENPLVRGSRLVLAAWGPPPVALSPLGGNGKGGEIPLNYFCRAEEGSRKGVSPFLGKREASIALSLQGG
jgi:hypothetical protein